MFTIEKASNLLTLAGVFFDADENGPQEGREYRHTLNMNDVWGWACADGEDVPDEQLPEVAVLFWKYGWAGILYWVSERNGAMRSEFHDNNRFIEFVRQEERLRREVPDPAERAYTEIRYELGVAPRLDEADKVVPVAAVPSAKRIDAEVKP